MNIPRPEHPRPDLFREQWLNLNGAWRFGFDPRTVGEQERWHPAGAGPRKDLTINVPFPWESSLSGIAARDYKGAAWYEREIT
ncbi:MAG TPA: glycoside hydrolase family 2, partial [Chloroflexota bacterium]|nr:glycoside hydrolase family 2 [Chloroflexota bacterium]